MTDAPYPADTNSREPRHPADDFVDRIRCKIRSLMRTSPRNLCQAFAMAGLPGAVFHVNYGTGLTTLSRHLSGDKEGLSADNATDLLLMAFAECTDEMLARSLASLEPKEE